MTAFWVVTSCVVYGGVGCKRRGGKGTLEEQITEEYLKKVVIIHWAQGMVVLLV